MTILYYKPKAKHSGKISTDWLYGIDLVNELKEKHKEWHWIPLENYKRMELRELYKKTNCFLRPTRHDGLSEMVLEALHFGCQVLWTKSYNDSILIKPEVKDIEEKLLQIERRSKQYVC